MFSERHDDRFGCENGLSRNQHRNSPAEFRHTGVLDQMAGTDGTAVKVTINVEFKSGRRKRQISGDDALALLRHVPEEELIIHGEGV